MTAPIWMAAPPEVHSALLASGPGPGAMLAAAGAWQALSAEYAATAAELIGVLGAVQAGSWEGPSAVQYVAAHAPYLAWLTQAQAKSDAAAAQHETAAAAYTTALATMPTLVELATNHVIHGVLVATNFFGLNTIPIALNEADYVRMWIQAAITMGTYQTFSAAATSAVPTTTPAPVVLNSLTGDVAAPAQLAAAAPAADAGTQLNLADLINQLLQAYLNYTQQLFAPITDFLQNPIGNTIQLVTDFLTNPAQALVTYGPFLFAVAYQAFSWVGSSLTYPQLLLQPLLVITLGIVAGVAEQLLGGFPVIAAEGGGAAAAVAGATQAAPYPLASLAPTVAGPAASAATGIGSGAGSAPASAAPATASPALAYAVAGFDPGGGFSPTVGGRTGAKAPAATVPAAAAGAAASSRRRARRKRQATLPERQYADEYLDYDTGPDPVDEPATAASSRGAGAMGFGGTAVKEDTRAAGLATLAEDSFGGGPTMPMLPNTWDADRPEQSP